MLHMFEANTKIKTEKIYICLFVLLHVTYF